MPTEMARRLAVASVDLMAAAEYVKELAKLRKQADANPKVIAALVVAAIVSYARPFSSSFSDGQAARKVHPTELGVFRTHPELRELHDRLIELRNRAVAHSDWKYHFSEDTKVGRVVLTWKLEKELEDLDAVLKLIGVMGVCCINLQYALDGKARPFKLKK